MCRFDAQPPPPSALSSTFGLSDSVRHIVPLQYASPIRSNALVASATDGEEHVAQVDNLRLSDFDFRCVASTLEFYLQSS